MGAIPSKAQELAKLCQTLRRQDIHFFAVTPSTTESPGQPDLVLVAGTRPVAIWLRRCDLAAPLSVYQYAQIEKAASRGWHTLIAFGASEALQELYRRGVAPARDDRSSHAASLAV